MNSPTTFIETFCQIFYGVTRGKIVGCDLPSSILLSEMLFHETNLHAQDKFNDS